jgi:phage gpG-like protein
MVRINVEADLGAASAALASAKAKVENTRGLMEVAGAIIENSTRDRFRTGSGPDGVPWPPSRRAIKQGGSTLIDKGGLLASITHAVEDNRVEIGVIAKTDSAKFSYVHQFGATIKAKNASTLVFRGADGHLVFAKQVTIPRRPFLGIDEQDRADLIEAWADYLEAVQ